MPTDTTGGGLLCQPPNTHADGLFPLMSDLHLLFPPRQASQAPATLTGKVARLRWWSSPFCIHRAPHASARLHTQPQPSEQQPEVNVCGRRTAKFWQNPWDSAQSDDWVAAAPHSQLSSRGSWETRCPCQLVQQSSLPREHKTPLQPRGKRPLEQVIIPQWSGISNPRNKQSRALHPFTPPPIGTYD